MKYVPIIVTLVWVTMASVFVLADQVYMCVGENGVKTYSNSPVCATSQNKGDNPYEVTTPPLASLPGARAPEEISVAFEEIAISGLIDMFSDFSGVPMVPVGVSGAAEVKISTQPWPSVLNQFLAEQGLKYGYARGALYIYPQNGLAKFVVTNPDMLRWFHDEKQWQAAIAQNDKVLSLPEFKGATDAEFTAEVVRRTKMVLGESSAPNMARPIAIKESFDAGGSGTVAVNKGKWAVHEERQRKAEIESLRREVDALKRENAKPKKKSVSCFTHGVQTRSGKVFSQNTVCR